MFEPSENWMCKEHIAGIESPFHFSSQSLLQRRRIFAGWNWGPWLKIPHQWTHKWSFCGPWTIQSWRLKIAVFWSKNKGIVSDPQKRPEIVRGSPGLIICHPSKAIPQIFPGIGSKIWNEFWWESHGFLYQTLSSFQAPHCLDPLDPLAFLISKIFQNGHQPIHPIPPSPHPPIPTFPRTMQCHGEVRRLRVKPGSSQTPNTKNGILCTMESISTWIKMDQDGSSWLLFINKCHDLLRKWQRTRGFGIRREHTHLLYHRESGMWVLVKTQNSVDSQRDACTRRRMAQKRITWIAKICVVRNTSTWKVKLKLCLCAESETKDENNNGDEKNKESEKARERERRRKNILKDNGTKQTCSHKEPFTQEICHTTRTPLRNKDLFGKRHLYSLYTRNTHNQDILHKDPVAHCFCLPSSAMGSHHWGGYGSNFKTLETKDAGHLSHVRVSIAVFRDPIMLDMRNHDLPWRQSPSWRCSTHCFWYVDVQQAAQILRGRAIQHHHDPLKPGGLVDNPNSYCLPSGYLT